MCGLSAIAELLVITPQRTLQRRHFGLSVQACPVTSVFLSLRKNTERISMELRQVITTNRLNYYILGEIGTGRGYDRKFERDLMKDDIADDCYV